MAHAQDRVSQAACPQRHHHHEGSLQPLQSQYEHDVLVSTDCMNPSSNSILLPVESSSDAGKQEEGATVSKHNWQPWPLTFPALITLALLHIVYLASLEAATRQYMETTFEGNDHGRYFVWQFLARVFAAALGALWEIIDINLRQLMPFYLMARKCGACPKDSILMDYVTSFNWLVPFEATYKRHWLVALSSTAYVIGLTAVPTMAGLMWDVQWLDSDYALVDFRMPWLRAVQAVNAVLAAIAIAIAVVLRLQKSGLVRDPRNAASIASLISENHELLEVLRQLNSLDSHKNIGEFFKLSRFFLRRIHGTRDSLQIAIAYTPSTISRDQAPAVYKPKRSEAHPIWLWGRIILLEEAALVAPYVAIQLATGSFGFDTVDLVNPSVAKVLYSLTFATLANIWQIIQRELSLLEPYYQMATLFRLPNGRCRSADIQEYVSRPSVSITVYAFRKTAYILAFVSLMCVYQQLAMVFFPPVWEAFYNSILNEESRLPSVVQRSLYIIAGFNWPFSLISLITVIYMARRRRKAIMPRQPRTLASQMLYICGSPKSMESLQNTSLMNDRQFHAHIIATERYAQFGWFKGAPDGAWRVGIEESPIERLYSFPQVVPAGLSEPASGNRDSEVQ